MEQGPNEGKSYEVLKDGGAIYHPWLVLLREVTEARDWQVVDSETSRGFVGICQKERNRSKCLLFVCAGYYF